MSGKNSNINLNKLKYLKYKNKYLNLKKMIGGGRTEQEIINELKTKKKYEEWISLGSYFGWTSDTLRSKYFSVRPYMYYNVDGKIVNVSMISREFGPHVDNIAVFKQHYVIDPTHVDQSTYRIVNISESLSTTGLATCTGLAMIIGTKKFMTHLDAGTPIYPIIYAINQIIETEGIVPGSLKPIIYAGDQDSSLTLEKAKEICSKVEIPETNYNIKNICFTDRVKI